MITNSNFRNRHLPCIYVLGQALVISTVLVIGTSQSMAAVESITSEPVDQLPQNIRTQLVQASGGATITDVHVDRNHGDPRYVAHFRDPDTKEMRTVTLGQMGNIIDSGAIPVAAQDTAVGGASGMKPDRVAPLPSDGPVPVNPPQRPVAPAMSDTPSVANSNQEVPSENNTSSGAAIPRPSPTMANDKNITDKNNSEKSTAEQGAPDNNSANNSSTNNSAKPFGIPPKDEDRDRNKAPVPSPRKFDNNGPESQKSPAQKNNK